MAALLSSSAAVSGGVVAGYRFLTRSPHFAIREIRVSSTAHVGADALRARTGLALGENLLVADLGEAERRLRREPWVAAARARRELPGTVAIEVTEQEAACAVVLEKLYLADRSGSLFKRASPEEAASLPVVTGITRDGYVHDREESQGLVREGLAALEAWRRADRPPIGEIHVDAAAGTTLYTRSDGVAIRLGRGDPETLAARLGRVDLAWRALAEREERPSRFLVDQESRPDRVTVRLASAPAKN